MTPRDRRALIFGGAVIVAAALVLRGVPALLRGVAGLRARASEAAEAAGRARDVLATTPTLRDSLTRTLGAVVALGPKLLESGTAADAGASLAGQINALASESALRVVRLDPLPDSAGVFGRVAVRAELEGDVKGLTRFLVRIEQGLPVLSVASLGVVAPAPNAPPNAPQTLRIEATISGLFLRRGAP